jgi:hypothetical protein
LSVVFGPRVFFVLALIFSAGYALMPRKQPAPRTIDAQAVNWVATRLDRSTATLSSPGAEGSLEALRAANDARMDTLLDARPAAPAPPTPPETRTLEELTVAALIRALEASLRSVPDAIPHLPLVPGMVRAIVREDPDAISFGPVPAGAWAYFTPSAPGSGRPKIVMSRDLKRLHTRGVPTPLLADVLLHELDHWMLFALGKSKGMKRNDIEESAFRSEGYFLSAMMPNKGKGGGDAVDAAGDPERDAYLAELRKIRSKMFAGELPQMIRESYGPNPDEAAGAQRKR